MKKMNFFLTRVLDKVTYSKGLLTFAMLLWLGFGLNTVSAQYVSSNVAIQRLTQANLDIMNTYDMTLKSGNTVAITRADILQSVYRQMIQDIKAGASVTETVKKYVGTGGLTPSIVYSTVVYTRGSQDLAWLKNEIINLLKL